MTRGRIPPKQIVLLALAVAAAGLGAVLLFHAPARHPPPAAPAPTGHSQETPQPGEKTAPAKIISYRSTMMPGEVSLTPGKDSMGMEMVPVYETEGGMLELSDHARAMASVETVPVQRRRLNREIRAVGKVQFNERGLAEITSRVEGYVERLFVDYAGVEVPLGAPLVEIYSPDLIVAQQELLIALESPHGSDLVEAATRKLLRWGVTQGQVDELMRNKKIHERLTLFSPVKGTVTEKLVVQKSAVKPGDVLYRLANLDSVWVALDIYEHELPRVHLGQAVRIISEAIPGQTFTGRVWFINPVLNEETRTVKVLLTIGNTGQRLKPGMFVSAIIGAALTADGRPKGGPPLLSVPVTAVLDSGVRKVVYVEKGKGRFAPVEIVTGPRTDDSYPVLSGLNEGDRVVTRGNFLLDSQFQIRGLPSLFYKEGQAAALGHQHGGAAVPAKEAPPPPPAGRPKAQGHSNHAPRP